MKAVGWLTAKVDIPELLLETLLLAMRLVSNAVEEHKALLGVSVVQVHLGL